MIRLCSVSLVLLAFAMVMATGCSSPASVGSNPLLPDQAGAAVKAHNSAESQTHLWGYYDVSIGIASQTATATLNRQAMFTANVVNFINGKPANLGFHINGTSAGADYVDVDIDVTITHPFPGLPQYNGYDVRGVFMGDGSATLSYNPELLYPTLSTDQYMLPDPVDGFGGADGYTRWFNYTEFSTGGMPLFQYTPGKMASAGFAGTATINPCRYYADGLGSDEDLWTWLGDHASQHGQFSSGTANTRNYYLRFPNSKGVKYGYAIIADWSGTDPSNHPSNAPESVACAVADSSTVYYAGPSSNGGDLKLDISVWNWNSAVSGGVMGDYKIVLESTVLSNPHAFNTGEMTPISGGEHYSTYQVDIPADNVNSLDGNEYWVIVEQQEDDYTNPYNVTNLADADPLAAFFRFGLSVGAEPTNTAPIINSITDDIDPAGLNTTVISANTSVTYSVDYTDPDVGQTHTISWYIEDATAIAPTDPPDTMPYNWAPKAVGDYKIWVKVNDGFVSVTSGPYAVTKVVPGWARTWGGGLDWDEGWRVAVDNSGNAYVAGCFKGSVDFDPGSGSDYHSSKTGTYFDAFLSKFDSSGNFLWARTWGGDSEDIAKSVAISGDSVYVCGYYRDYPVDFNPDPVLTDIHPCNGDRDSFVSKFSTDGAFIWAQTWGGINREWGGESVGADSSGNVYVGGWNESPWQLDLRCYSSAGTLTWSHIWLTGAGYCKTESMAVESDALYITGCFSGSNCDFDPGSGTDPMTSTGTDGFICRFDLSGNYQWGRHWGNSEVWPKVVAVDPSGYHYVGGTYVGSNVDFDPGPGTDYHSTVVGGDRDAFLSKFNSSGDFVWARTWGGSSEDWTCGADFDAAGNVFITGRIRSPSVDFDPGPSVDTHTNNGGGNTFDAFCSRFNPSGDFVWAVVIGGASHDMGNDLAFGAGSIYYTGTFSSYMDFDPGSGTDFHNTNGSEDIFLSKMTPNGTW